MRRAALALLLLMLLAPCVVNAQGAVVYQYELAARTEAVLVNGQSLPGIDGHYTDGVFVNSGGSTLDVVHFLGSAASFPLSGRTCTSTMCYWATFHFTKVTISPPSATNSMGWTAAPLVLQYDAKQTATTFWSGRWVMVVVANALTTSPIREIMIFAFCVVIATRAGRVVMRYVAPDVLPQGQGDDAATQQKARELATQGYKVEQYDNGTVGGLTVARGTVPLNSTDYDGSE